MNISPMDIKRQVFKKNIRGYDVDEVSHFLEMVAAHFEELLKEKKELSERADRLKFEVEKYEKLEKTIQETLINSQKVFEESKTNAEHEAKLIIKDAEIKAEEYKRITEKEEEDIKKDLISLQEQKKIFIIRFRSLIKSQLEMLNILESELDSADKTSKVLTTMKNKSNKGENSANAVEKLNIGKNFSAKL